MKNYTTNLLAELALKRRTQAAILATQLPRPSAQRRRRLIQANTVPGAHEARVNQSTDRLPCLASKAWTCSASRRQPRGQSYSTGRPFTQPTAAAR